MTGRLPSGEQKHVLEVGGADSIGVAAPPEQGPARNSSETAILDAAQKVGETVLGPHAQESDLAPGPNPVNFRALADAGLLGSLFLKSTVAWTPRVRSKGSTPGSWPPTVV